MIFPLLAFAPAAFWLWFFIRRGVYRPGPRRLLVFTFALGMVSTIPAGILNTIFIDESVIDDPAIASLASVAAAMLLVVGPVEETCKFLAVRLLAYRSPYFDEPGDGLIYSAAASLGFASLENLLYILTFGPAVMLVRAPLSTVAHVVFGSFWGLAMGHEVRAGRRRNWETLAGVAGGAVVHGMFNVAVFVFWPASALLVIFGIAWTSGRFAWARRVSPFRYRRNYPRVDCPVCQRRISVISRYCRYCGTYLEPIRGEIADLYCSYCDSRNRLDAGFCARCGDQLLH